MIPAKGLSKEISAKGIRVNTVAQGYTETDAAVGSAIERLSRPPQTSVPSLQGCDHASPFGSRPQQKSERQRLDHITAVKEKRFTGIQGKPAAWIAP